MVFITFYMKFFQYWFLLNLMAGHFIISMNTVLNAVRQSVSESLFVVFTLAFIAKRARSRVSFEMNKIILDHFVF